MFASNNTITVENYINFFEIKFFNEIRQNLKSSNEEIINVQTDIKNISKGFKCFINPLIIWIYMKIGAFILFQRIYNRFFSI